VAPGDQGGRGSGRSRRDLALSARTAPLRGPAWPGNLIIHLRKLEEADYISSEKTRNGTVSMTTVALTGHGRKALGAYTQALRDLLGGL
jgi:hypothetical protein